MIAYVASRPHDLAVGRRRPVGRGVWPWHARLGNPLVLTWLRHRAAFPIHDIAPIRVGRRADLLALDVADRRFGYPVEVMQRATARRLAHHRARRELRARARRARSRRSPARSVGTAQGRPRLLEGALMTRRARAW